MNGSRIMKTETLAFNKGERKYPLTELVPPKPLINYDEKGPYGDFGNEEALIEYLESLDDRTFRKLSDLYTVMVKDKGGWLFTDRLYEDSPRTELDRAIYNLRSCRSVHDRKHLVREQLIKLLEEYLATGGFSEEYRMEIFDLGSGPSDYTIEAFSKCISRNNASKTNFPMHATCIDINPAALRRGRKLAEKAGVGKHIEYKRGRMGTMLKKGRIRDADLITAIGVICPLSDDITMKLFERVRKALKPGGRFYTCAMRHHPLENILNKAGWRLNNREPEKLEKMLRESGYGNLDIYLGPEEFFVMALGQKTD
jgi:SAM-dependent methyltransferase